MYYALRLNPDQDLRAFYSEQKARECGKGYSVFSNSDDLAATDLTHEELMEIYWRLTGYETRIVDRVYLCDLIWENMLKLGITASDQREAGEASQAVEPARTESVYDIAASYKGVSGHEPEEANEKVPQHEGASKIGRPGKDFREDDADGEIPLVYNLESTRYYEYTQRERTAFNFLSRRHPKQFSFAEMAEQFDADPKIVTTVVRSLRRKMVLNGEATDIIRSKTQGERGHTYGIGERY